MQQQMTPQEALSLLNNVTSKYQGTREDHVLIEQAINVLSGVLPPAETVEPSVGDDELGIEDTEAKSSTDTQDKGALDPEPEVTT